MPTVDRFPIPPRLAAQCRKSADHQDWLRRLPERIHALAARWTVALDPPFDSDETSSAWVARDRVPMGRLSS